MKKLIFKISFIFIFTFFGHIRLYSQSSDGIKNRIVEIKKWYSEIQNIGLINCKSKSFIKYEDPFNSNARMPFDQTVNICRLNNIYLVRKAQYQGYEWSEDVFIYSKNEKIFFVFVKGSTEGYSYEKRFYCNSEEKIIKQLDQETEYGKDDKKENVENKTNLYKDIDTIIDINIFNRINN
jgi:hypothetical protein